MILNTTTLQIKDATLNTKNVKQLIDGSGNILNLSALQDTDGNLITKSNGLPIVFSDPNSSNFYNISFNIAPTTLTTGLNYFVIRNPNSTNKIKIKRIVADAFFIGTAATSKSVYVLKKLGTVTATTGTTIPIALSDSNGSSSIAEIKQLSTGLTTTGFIDLNNISHIAHANQLTAKMNKKWTFDTPLVLNQNEALVLQSEGALLAGSNIILSIQWYEI